MSWQTATPPGADPGRRLLALAWRYRATCLVALGFQVALLLLAVGGLGISGAAIDLVRRGLDGTAPAVHWPFGLAPPAGWSTGRLLLGCGAAVLVMAAARALLTYGYAIAVGQLVHLQIVPELRTRVFDKLQRLSFRFFDRNASGSIINRVTGDVQAVRSFVDGVLLQGAVIGLSLGIYLAYMLRTHVGLTLACLAPTPLIWLATSWFSRWARPAYEKNRGLVDAMVLALSEGTKGIRVTKIFGREAHELERFQRKNRAVLEQQEQIFRRVSQFSPAVSFITEINIAVLLLYGGYLVARQSMTLGELVVFTGLVQQFAAQISTTAGIFNTLEQSVIAARRVFEVLDAPLEIESPPAPVRLAPARGAVRFDDVTFGYHAAAPVLRGLELGIEPGQCVAIFGATGAGKSTLLSLVPRFYDPLRGQVSIDGVDARRLELSSLRRSVGLVFQESLLFRSTVAENIAFGHPEASRQAIERAARTAGAHDFITALPDGYDSVLEESAVNLSGGQRQRIAIARALLPEPAILLLDDPTAAVDAETEDEVLSAVDRARQGRTTLMVANRLSALRRADLVLVLDGGRIVERGTHAQLAASGGLYARAAALQVPDEAAPPAQVRA
jgi:ABC-type multidrug transport system fused ATPase/permease subunit